MLQVSFYHLTLTPFEKVVPKLLEKVYAANLRSVVWVDSDERLAQLNSSLWTYSTNAFLPHGCKLDHEDLKQRQPIWLTTFLENPNESTVCAVTNEKIIENPSVFGFERIVDIFDATNPQSLASYQLRLNHYQQLQANISLWQETKQGWQALSHDDCTYHSAA